MTDRLHLFLCFYYTNYKIKDIFCEYWLSTGNLHVLLKRRELAKTYIAAICEIIFYSNKLCITDVTMDSIDMDAINK